jgi:hypothetical protein
MKMEARLAPPIPSRAAVVAARPPRDYDLNSVLLRDAPRALAAGSKPLGTVTPAKPHRAVVHRRPETKARPHSWMLPYGRESARKLTLWNDGSAYRYMAAGEPAVPSFRGRMSPQGPIAHRDTG